jgi:DNA polymerase
MTRHAEREERLREMDIAPLWRRRLQGAPVAVATAEMLVADPADAVDSAVVAPRAAASPPVRVDDGAPRAADSAARDAPEAPAQDRRQTIALLQWDQLDPHIAACTACALGRTRRNSVPGVGSATAQWMFVGEAPGAEEDAKGEPFVGQAGRLLDNMLRAIGLDRARDVYIANVLKCRPPNNRNPEPGEVARCAPYLERQLELIRPRVIVALGRFAAMTLLDTDSSIASLRGRVHQYRGVPLIVTYHPAYLLRNLPDKAKAWEDLVFARRTLARLQSDANTPS